MDRIKEMLDQLSELDDAQVEELKSAILAEFETVEKETPLTPQTVDAMTSLAEMHDSVQTEIAARAAKAEELVNQATQAATRIHGQDGAEENMDASSLTEGEDPLADPTVDPAVVEGDLPVEDVPPADAPPMDMPTDMPVEDFIPADVPSDAAAPENPFDPEGDAGSEEPETAPEDSPVDVTEDVAEGEDPNAPEEDKKGFSTMSEASAPAEEATELSTETVTTEDAPVELAADAVDDAEAAVETPEATELSAQDNTNMEAPVTAAAVPAENLDIEVPADRRPVPQATAAPVAITAGADIPGYTAGSSMNDMNDVAEAMVKRIHSLRRVNGGDGEQHIVASLTTSYPEDRTLGTDAQSNWDKVHEVQALVAAGGHQAPFEVKYDIFGFGTDARPVKAALPSFQADRGGIRYILPPVLSSYPNAVGIWTAANDAAQTPNPAAKNSLTVAAAVETTVATDAVTLQLQFGNLVTRAYPELVARHNELALIQHAREAEQNLLAGLTAGSTAVTTSSLIGVARDFLVQVGKAATGYRSRHRLDPKDQLRVIIPSWVKDAMVADLTLAMPGDSTMSAGSVIDGYLSDRGVSASYTLDQDIFGAQTVAALLEFPDSFTWWIFAEGTFLFLDGGTLDIGIIRDSTLVGTNDYKMFLETFEAVAKVGIEGLAVTSSISVNGVAAALRDTTGGATAAAIEY